MERKVATAAGTTFILRWRAAWAGFRERRILARRVTAVAIPITVGALVFFEVRAFRVARDAPIDSPRPLVARRALPAGQPITAIDFTLGTVDKTAPGAILDVDLHRLRGAKTAVPLSSGAVLTAAMLIPAAPETTVAERIPKGMRAYSLAGADGLGARSGDRVDVYVEPTEGDAPFVVAEAVPVLRRGEGGDLVVALSAVAIRTVEKARRRGKLTVALRHPDDASVTEARARHRAPRARSIQILSESP